MLNKEAKNGVRSLETRSQLSRWFWECKKIREIFGTDLTATICMKQSIRRFGENTGIHASAIIMRARDLTDCCRCHVPKIWAMVNTIEGDLSRSRCYQMDFWVWKSSALWKRRWRDQAKPRHRHCHWWYSLDDELLLTGCTNRAIPPLLSSWKSGYSRKYLRELKPDKFADLIAWTPYPPRDPSLTPWIPRPKMGKKQVVFDCPRWKIYLLNLWHHRYIRNVMLLSQNWPGLAKEMRIFWERHGKKPCHSR